jgi:hypothetical protein
MRRTFLLAASILAVSATSAVAQGRGRNTNGVPPGQRPPAGMCRVWIDGVPPGHQPAVTDCTTAQLNVPLHGRVIYGSGVLPTTGNIFTRSRQLADGSWVLDRYRVGANGQTYLISTSPSRNGAVGRRVRGDNDEQGENNGNRAKVKKAKTHGRDGEVENDNENEHDNRSVLGTTVPRGVEMDDHGRGNGNGNNGNNGKGKGKH